jgi:D-alanyl-D-alanine carboxypeptidase
MPDQQEIDRAAVISAMSRAKQNEAAKATMLVQKALSPTKPVALLHSTSLFRKVSSLDGGSNNNIASSCPTNLTVIEKQPDVVLDTTAGNNTLPIDQTNTNE